ncbi:MAG: flagellar motor switch protein FliN [Thermodesulfobacteriota bacterium]|nr:flagellar motor switch protein FliN [Thermodesulfobacteriota bacterium]
MEEKDQDALAEEWAAALDEQGEAEDSAASEAGEAGEAAEAGGEGGDAEEAGAPETAEGGGGGDDDALAEEWAAALATEEETAMKKEEAQKGLAAQSSEAAFKDLTEEAKVTRPDGVKRDLDFILDIPLDVSAELGRTKLLINELLQLGQGSVIELNKLAGEPLEIYVNGKLVARGEAVVINEKFGIRLTDIISPIERVKQLA